MKVAMRLLIRWKMNFFIMRIAIQWRVSQKCMFTLICVFGFENNRLFYWHRFDSNGTNNINNISNEQTMESSDNSNGIVSRFCYCGKDRNLDVVELQCAKCLRWFHENCITTTNIGKLVKFMTCYTFVCKLCSPNQMECFTKRQTSM